QKCVAAASERLVHFLTDIDYDRHLALVCVAHEGNTERIVGEARYVVNPDGKTCEFAIVIADAWHKTGVAGLLMHELIAAAREHGLETMESPVLALNWDMLRFAHGFGFEVRHVPNELSVVQIAKRLQSDRTDAKAVPRLKEAKS
ncbi:MAG: N-acetyltransferase family protein, partial [Burkholderiales bacterium]